jgi:hypothetical protein
MLRPTVIMPDIDQVVLAPAPPDDEDKKDQTLIDTQPSPLSSNDQLSVEPYRLYKRRFSGLVGLVSRPSRPALSLVLIISAHSSAS